MNDESEQATPQSVTLVKVVDANGLTRGGTVLHRYDTDAACAHRPDANTSTDLLTATVLDGHTLCDYCEWPEGAHEYVEAR